MRPARVALLGAGLVIGAAPWLIENSRTGFASLRSTEMESSSPRQALAQARVLVGRGLPVLLGGRSPGGRDATFPGAEPISVCFYLGLVVLGLGLARRPASPLARSQALSSIFLLVAPSLMALSRARTDLREDPRFLLSSWVGIALLTGVGLALLVERGARFRALALASLISLLGPLSQVRSPGYRDDPRHGRIAETIALSTRLAASGLHDVYAEYWIAYRLSFLSRGEVVASPFGEGAPGPVRDVRAFLRVDAAANPAFLLEPGPAARLLAFLDARASTYVHEPATGLGRELIWGITPDALATIRACRCFPAPESPAAGASSSGSRPATGADGPDRRQASGDSSNT